MQNFENELPRHRVILALYNGDTAVDIKRIDFGPHERKRKIYEKLPASEDNKLRASLRPVPDIKGGTDPFALDDTAYALLPLRKKQKVLMVTDDNLFLEGALLVYDNVDPLKVTPAEYDAKPSFADGMDVVIFDDHTPTAVPPSPTSVIYFHPTGPSSPFTVAEHEAIKPHITEIDEGHPVMRWLSMSDVYTDKSDVFVVDPKLGESALARSVIDTLIVAKRDGHRKILGIGFSLPAANRDSATDLPMRVAFPMMLVNALDWFAGDQSDLLTTYATGRRERVPLDGVVGATEADVRGPDGSTTHTPVIDGLATFYGSKVGYYDPDGERAPTASRWRRSSSPRTSRRRRRATSHRRPSSRSARSARRRHRSRVRRPRPTSSARRACSRRRRSSRSRTASSCGTYIIFGVLALILLEWVTYHRRITV